MPVAGVFPAVAGDLVGAAYPTGSQDDRLGAKNPEASAFAVVAEGTHHAAIVLQQRDDRALHVHLDALVDAVVLQGADHLQPGAVAHVRQAGILVTAKVSLQDAAVPRAIEQRAPRLQLAHALRRLLGMQFGHAAVVHVLAAAHGIREVHLPVVALVHVGQGCRNAALGMTVWALPRRDLQTRPTDSRVAEASIAARRPAPPAPITNTSYSCVS